MRVILPILLLTLTLFSCKKNVATNNGETAYIGGEIINPIDKQVVIYKENKVLDTILLDNKNRFLYKIEQVEDGLYTFKLKSQFGEEFQLALLESNDSIMIRLNTIDFDESLVYTGKGAKKNNYLINMFLENEAENDKILNYCQLEPKVFENKIDSIKQLKLKNLNTFIEKNATSALFKQIATGNINYSYYLSKEIYPFAYYGDNEIKNLQSLPDDFYNYRKHIDYNNTTLKEYFTYKTFLRYHIKNLALSEHLKKSKDTILNRNSFCYNLDKLKLIDSLITDQDIKNPLLSISSINYINNSKNIKQLDTFLAFYYSKSTDEKDKNHIKKLAHSLKQLEIGKPIPNVTLVNYKNQEIPLQKLINKPSVLYFWSKDYKSHLKESHTKVNELILKYPEVNFISVNIDDTNIRDNSRILKQYDFTSKNEYKFTNPKKAKETLAINPIIKVMLIDKKGKIIDPHTNLFSIAFEQQILGLLNQ
ncbi:peroxiredoxin family protein [Lacinutrix sp. C3R15]|uniref:TlpA family protein disulfide reductase n=1 Tax=Flavobacteriaceae TaxID=49546 RepID=UPI001C08B2F6|nr:MULTISPECIES: peroxiredoxin family protein [Flavobacteriaceae]MBU2938790.1 peroxiredoxin family protein [Lacinutrix sp. C3R15]MDO6622103.1 peroxiredoxin family protein [Oceanihabitans sp. 1_MG-2023]